MVGAIIVTGGRDAILRRQPDGPGPAGSGTVPEKMFPSDRTTRSTAKHGGPPIGAGNEFGSGGGERGAEGWCRRADLNRGPTDYELAVGRDIA